MTTSAPTLVPARLDFDSCAPAFSRAMSHLDNAATKQLDAAGVDHRLRELLRLRVSQLNGCAYCVDMHSTDARAVGETEQRLTGLPVWREAPFFTEAERAALAFAEAMVAMAETRVPRAEYDAVAEHYAPEQIAALVALVVTVSAWNAIGVSTRTWEPGSYRR
jgi:AhpD family alkylhydroperoxidase